MTHHSQVTQSEEQICKLRENLTEQAHERQQAEREMMRVNAQFSEAQEELEICQRRSTLALREKDDMKDHLKTLQQELSRAQEDVRLRDQLQRDLAAKLNEVDELKKSHSKHENAKQELISQQKIVAQKTKEARVLASQIETLQRETHELKQKELEKDILAERFTLLEKEAQGLRTQLSELPHLRDQLEKQNVRLEESQTALNKAKDDLAQIRKLEDDNNLLNETLEFMRADLAIANEGVRKMDAMQELLNHKDGKIRQVEEELATYVSASEELFQTKADLVMAQNELLQIRNRLSVLEIEQAATLPPRPVRRAPNRSTQKNVAVQDNLRSSLEFDRVAEDQIPATSLTDTSSLVLPNPSLNLTTSSQSFVADTQLDNQQTLQEIPDSFQPQHRDFETLNLFESGDTSPLTEIANPFEQGGYLEDDRMGYLEEPIASLPSADRDENLSNQSAERLESASQRPPSSSYGSVNEQMLLDVTPQTESQPRPTPHPRSAGMARKSRTTRSNRVGVESEQIEVSIPGGDSKKDQRLKIESQTDQQQSTAGAGGRPETPRDRESTPSLAREKHQPNSAAKRKIGQMEDHQPLKPLKRTPANLEVRGPGTSKANSEIYEQTPSKKTVTFRRSSVVGTNAPAPGKGQKPSKSSRRGSRQERYSSRFGA